jgi:hypothetical protein
LKTTGGFSHFPDALGEPRKTTRGFLWSDM